MPVVNGHVPHPAAPTPHIPPGISALDSAAVLAPAVPSQSAFPLGVKAPEQEAIVASQFQTAVGAQRPPSAAPQQSQAQSQQRVPSTLSDLVASMEEVKHKGALVQALCHSISTEQNDG
jgi:hypothetical protein